MKPVSLAKYIQKSPFLTKLLLPVSNAYVHLSGYRKYGLRYDDLMLEENDDTQKALSRLPKMESYDRVYRIRRAMQLSIENKILPKSEWTKPEEDYHYLRPVLAEVIAERKEREAFDALIVKKPETQAHATSSPAHAH
ncbi:hypothetical protein POMI540_4519 [Schizosaccharomyces pombe]